ncbi:hypothetical protein DXG01_009268 [Tephrocybe rancida]|nr:hypothetical protein DXG01_009268 [Tephrocybe rancida]
MIRSHCTPYAVQVQLALLLLPDLGLALPQINSSLAPLHIPDATPSPSEPFTLPHLVQQSSGLSTSLESRELVPEANVRRLYHSRVGPHDGPSDDEDEQVVPEVKHSLIEQLAGRTHLSITSYNRGEKRSLSVCDTSDSQNTAVETS